MPKHGPLAARTSEQRDRKASHPGCCCCSTSTQSMDHHHFTTASSSRPVRPRRIGWQGAWQCRNGQPHPMPVAQCQAPVPSQFIRANKHPTRTIDSRAAKPQASGKRSSSPAYKERSEPAGVQAVQAAGEWLLLTTLSMSFKKKNPALYREGMPGSRFRAT